MITCTFDAYSVRLCVQLPPLIKWPMRLLLPNCIHRRLNYLPFNVHLRTHCLTACSPPTLSSLWTFPPPLYSSHLIKLHFTTPLALNNLSLIYLSLHRSSRLALLSNCTSSSPSPSSLAIFFLYILHWEIYASHFSFHNLALKAAPFSPLFFVLFVGSSWSRMICLSWV